MGVLIYALRSRSNDAERSAGEERSAHAGENFPRRRYVGSSPERHCGALTRRESSAKGRGGDGESHQGTRGGWEARRTVGDEDPRRRRWLVAEGGDARSGRLGVASNGLRWVRRTSGWRPIPSAERGATGRRSSEASAMAARICTRFGDGLSRKGVREVYGSAARARGGLGGVFEGGVR